MDMKKVIAKLPVGFLEEAAGMDGDQLRAEIVKAETSIHEVEKAMKADEHLEAARQVAKDLVGAYSDARTAQRAKISYTLTLLDERGELSTGAFATDEVPSAAPRRSEPVAAQRSRSKSRAA